MKAWQRRSFSLYWSRSSVDRLATPLGINESLAFRAFDKTIIFRHWLSKHKNWNWPSGLSFWKKKKRLLLYPSRLFSKEQKSFSKKILFQKGGFEVFSHGALWLSSHALQISSHALPLSSHDLQLSSHALPLSFTCKHKVAKFNFHYTFILFPYIYLLCFEKVFPLHYGLHDIYTLLSRTWAPHC